MLVEAAAAAGHLMPAGLVMRDAPTRIACIRGAVERLWVQGALHDVSAYSSEDTEIPSEVSRSF